MPVYIVITVACNTVASLNANLCSHVKIKQNCRKTDVLYGPNICSMYFCEHIPDCLKLLINFVLKWFLWLK